MNSVVNLLVFNFSNVSSVDVCCDNLIAEFRRCYWHRISNVYGFSEEFEPIWRKGSG